jgi:hypothetical protein
MPRNNSPIDWKKVMEGRALINHDDDLKDAPVVHKMFILFDKRPDLAEGLSVNELALILWEKEVYYDKQKKRDLPTKFAYDKAETYLQLLNKWILNKSLAVYATRGRDGKWRYFNKQKMKEYADSEKQGTNIIEGIKSRQEKIKKIIRLPKKSKEKNTTATRRFIKIAAINRKRKSKGDDTFYG